MFGSDKTSYETLFPKDSFIHVQDFPKGPESLAKYLQKLDKVKFLLTYSSGRDVT